LERDGSFDNGKAVGGTGINALNLQLLQTRGPEVVIDPPASTNDLLAQQKGSGNLMNLPIPGTD